MAQHRPARWLLVQARLPGDPMRHEERASFARELGVPLEAVRTVDCLRDPLDAEPTAEVDAVLVGGSGDHSVLGGHPGVRALVAFMGRLAASDLPVFASCFGFQALVVATGGRVVHDPAHAEVGTFLVERTPEGADDDLFRVLPPRFHAQEGHRDRAEAIGPDLVVLARSALAPIQAVRVRGRPVWATQFHPELDVEDNRRRLLRYADRYAGLGGVERLLANYRPSPHTGRLLAAFRREVVLPRLA